MNESSIEYRLGYQQAQLDILEWIFATNDSTYGLSGDKTKLAQAILAIDDPPKPASISIVPPRPSLRNDYESTDEEIVV